MKILNISAICLSVMLVACDNNSHNDDHRGETEVAELPAVEFEDRVVAGEFTLLNEEAPVPPQCYTKTESKHNPCYTCHQKYDDRETVYRVNKLDDGGIQGEYLFSDIGTTNHWKNLFVDKTLWVESISDQTIKTYIDQDNYTPLIDDLKEMSWEGFIPDLENYQLASEAFDEDGFAKDGSAWVAFNYKPLPSTFWPTNGSTDDVLIRLPEKFRTLDGEYNQAIYQVNLALVEVSLKQLDIIDIVAIDETFLALDLNNDNLFSEQVEQIPSREYYVGDASQHKIIARQFPLGTEFMHSVRYIGIDENGGITTTKRMKELRYMQKIKELTDSELSSRFDRERKEKMQKELPSFVEHENKGFSNGLGWNIQGYIEDYDGALRPQSYEEQMFCMGCHSAIGSTVDSTFSFVRKVTGKKGWSYINLRGMKDAPSVTQNEGEILQYLSKSGGGNEFRENYEMLARWFNEDGTPDTDRIGDADVYELITPSPDRALELNKAYAYVVRHQSYIHGRDANTKSVKNVYETIDESNPPLESEYRFFGWDMQLDWN